MSDLRKRMGKIIRARRVELNMSQEQLAEKIDKTTGFVGQLERGESAPGMDTLHDIVYTLGLDANKLIMGEISEENDFDTIRELMTQMSPKGRSLLLEIAKVLCKMKI